MQYFQLITNVGTPKYESIVCGQILGEDEPIFDETCGN